MTAIRANPYPRVEMERFQSQVKFILSQHLKRAKGNSERKFSYLVSRIYIASL